MNPHPFRWPAGKRAAVSLSFDDGRISQVEVGVPLFDKHDIKATFYVSFNNVEQRLDAWKRAAANGHEIGNHTITHPCSGNHAFTRTNALETLTLERMEQELTGASDKIEAIFGKRPTTFAYPCYEKTIGRGANVKSYIPLVAKHFTIGRGGLSETCNHPPFTDLAQIYSYDGDDCGWEQMKAWINDGIEKGGWIAFSGHEVGPPKYLSTDPGALEQLCRYCTDPANGIWIDTVAAVGKYVKENRTAI